MLLLDMDKKVDLREFISTQLYWDLGDSKKVNI
jgi:hypothetical protein